MIKSLEIKDVDNKIGLTGKPEVGINEKVPVVKESEIIEFSGEYNANVGSNR